MFKVVKDLKGGYTSQVQLVEYEGKQYVLRTATIEEVKNEKFFHELLKKNNIPSLQVFDEFDVADNQIVLEYIKDSPTLEEYVECGGNLEIGKKVIEKWGRELRKIHNIEFDQIEYIKEDKQYSVSWEQFIENEITYGLERQKIRNTNLSNSFLENITGFLEQLKSMQPAKLCLVHCDPHENNVLLRGDDLIFFDKGSDVISSDALFDLIIVVFEFIGAIDGFEDLGDPCDREYLQAFIKGYGYDFTQDALRFDLFLVLRAFTRHPNPFTPFLDTIMIRVLQKYT